MAVSCGGGGGGAPKNNVNKSDNVHLEMVSMLLDGLLHLPSKTGLCYTVECSVCVSFSCWKLSKKGAEKKTSTLSWCRVKQRRIWELR